jgi:hypothetical protein
VKLEPHRRVIPDPVPRGGVAARLVSREGRRPLHCVLAIRSSGTIGFVPFSAVFATIRSIPLDRAPRYGVRAARNPAACKRGATINATLRAKAALDRAPGRRWKPSRRQPIRRGQRPGPRPGSCHMKSFATNFAQPSVLGICADWLPCRSRRAPVDPYLHSGRAAARRCSLFGHARDAVGGGPNEALRPLLGGGHHADSVSSSLRFLDCALPARRFALDTLRLRRALSDSPPRQ